MGSLILVSAWIFAVGVWPIVAGPMIDAAPPIQQPDNQPVAPATQPAQLNLKENPASVSASTGGRNIAFSSDTQPASQPALGPYTRPSKPAIGFLSGKSAGSGASGMGSGGVARQASEAKVSASSLSTSGAAGLAAPQPGGGKGPVFTIPGIQRGYAAGLGFARQQNVLTWQRNPADRPCQDLIRAGFLPGAGMCGRMR